MCGSCRRDNIIFLNFNKYDNRKKKLRYTDDFDTSMWEINNITIVHSV